MIAVDTSSLAAIAFEEDDGEMFSERLALEDAIVGTPTLLELALVLSRLGADQADVFISRMIDEGDLRPVEFSVAMYRMAQDAHRRFGEGHPAQLNFGDCMSYAVAKSRGLPLLFKGNDFTLTDIEPAWRP